MGDWSILGRFLTELQNHSTVIGKIWLTMLLIFRILLVTLIGDAVYGDEQSKFTCNTLQPGCSNVCYDTFAPVSHLRFWVFQIVLVSTPSIFYVVYVLHKITNDEKLEMEDVQAVEKQQHPSPDVSESAGSRVEEATDADTSTVSTSSEEDWGLQEGECVEQSLLEEDFSVVAKDPTRLSRQVLLIYIIHVLLRSILEITFLLGQCYLFGFEVPYLFRCETYPCPNRTDCFVSRATEKTIFLNFMFSVSLGCFILNIAELHYLGWVYIFRVLCSACSACCKLEKDAVERLGFYANYRSLLLQLRHSLRSRVVRRVAEPSAVQERSGDRGTRAPALSFETDFTVQCTSIRSPDHKEHTNTKLASMTKLGRGQKPWA
ncbi:gap junction delta-2 protein-like [Chanos chanos]|uniref:Gap junction delta-2 protein-like n=1 Tax=Chanos chanos TaxID=29144 RepID=A0A6J2WV77_CHACN|nr:gap junction delta-2 protein-like [Chanos chanos]